MHIRRGYSSVIARVDRTPSDQIYRALCPSTQQKLLKIQTTDHILSRGLEPASIFGVREVLDLSSKNKNTDNADPSWFELGAVRGPFGDCYLQETQGLILTALNGHQPPD